MKYMPEIIQKIWFVLSHSWILRFMHLWPLLADLSYIYLVIECYTVYNIKVNQSQNTGIAQHWDFQLCFKDSDIPTAFFLLWISWQRSSTKWFLSTNLWGLNEDSPHLLALPESWSLPWVSDPGSLYNRAMGRQLKRMSHCALGGCLRREAELHLERFSLSIKSEARWQI